MLAVSRGGDQFGTGMCWEVRLGGTWGQVLCLGVCMHICMGARAVP